jgi:hypothetical protein
MEEQDANFLVVNNLALLFTVLEVLLPVSIQQSAALFDKSECTAVRTLLLGDSIIVIECHQALPWGTEGLHCQKVCRGSMVGL